MDGYKLVNTPVAKSTKLSKEGDGQVIETLFIEVWLEAWDTGLS